jgi:hypothetical protein
MITFCSDEFTNLKDLKLSCSLVLAKKAFIDKKVVNNEIKETMVYPNPNTGNFYIECDNNTEITVFNMLGKLVYSNLHSSKSEINLGELPKGIYILKAEFNR